MRHPWSVLAFQLAGADGLGAIHADGLDGERETTPAEPQLAALLELPRRRGLATLVLVDEVLMYAREKAGLDPVWRGRIVDFFQYLTQAVGKVDTAAMVASILATDPHKQRGELGSRLTSELADVFRRQREEGVQPVQKDDVPVVLRRRGPGRGKRYAGAAKVVAPRQPPQPAPDARRSVPATRQPGQGRLPKDIRAALDELLATVSADRAWGEPCHPPPGPRTGGGIRSSPSDLHSAAQPRRPPAAGRQ